MKRHSHIAFSLIFSFLMGASFIGTSGIALAQVDGPQGIQPAKPQVDKILKSEVRGELEKIDGDVYTVKEMTGKEVRLQIDKETRLDQALKPGDHVEAKITPQGNVWSLKKMAE